MFNVFSLSVLFLYLKFCTLYATPKNPKREEKGEKKTLIVNEILFKQCVIITDFYKAHHSISHNICHKIFLKKNPI